MNFIICYIKSKRFCHQVSFGFFQNDRFSHYYYNPEVGEKEPKRHRLQWLSLKFLWGNSDGTKSKNTHNLPRNTHCFPTGAEGDQVATLFFLPPNTSLLLPASLVLKLMPERAALETFLTCVCVCVGEQEGGGLANNQARYTNLRWQHLVYLKLEGQLY